MTGAIPHLRVVVIFCAVAVIGYAAFSAWAVLYSGDPALRGDVIGTWKSFAVAVFAFWVGSSSGGKAQSGEPQPVNVVNPPTEPVPIEETRP